MECFLVNHSTAVSDTDARAIAAACNQQNREHFAKAWGPSFRMTIRFAADEAKLAPAARRIALLDDADQQGDLGWHTEDSAGIYGRVFAKPVLDNGGDILHRPLSVASVASHEFCEMAGDPFCSLWAAGPRGRLYAYETCDPVESDSYRIGDVTVSNFVLPAWFNPFATDGLDWLAKLSKPFTMSAGGYVVYQDAGGEHQQFGAHYPAWRRKTKKAPLARTATRLHQAAA